MTFEPLRTDRLLLRPMRATDAEPLTHRRSDPDVARYQNWTAPYPIERAHAIVGALVVHLTGKVVRPRSVTPSSVTHGAPAMRSRRWWPPLEDGATVAPWHRAVVADGHLAGFVMIARSQPGSEEPWLWRLLVDRMHQRRGIGSCCVETGSNQRRAHNVRV